MPKTKPSPMTECDSCGTRMPAGQLAIPLRMLKDLPQRLDAGSEVPAGECLCGALAYLVKPKKKLKVLVEVLGGVAEVTKCPAEVQVTIKDHDNEQHK